MTTLDEAVQTPGPIVRDPARLAALRRVALLDTPADDAFDRLTRLAARMLHAPVALVSLVDEDRQFFKSCVGLPEPWASKRETPLTHSFCQHAVASGEPLIVEDARTHPLLHTNQAIPELGIVAYAGVPLVTSDGHALGSFCVIDRRPRRWTEDEVALLRDLAASVMTELELREAQREAERRAQVLLESERRYKRLVEGCPDAIVVHVHSRIVYANAAAAALFGADHPAALLGRSVLDMLHPDDRSIVRERMRQVTEAGQDVPSLEERFIRFDGIMIDVEAVGIATTYEGQPGVQSVLRDITERKRVEAALRESQARLQSILDNTTSVVYVKDTEGRFLLINRQFERLFRVSRDVIVGKSDYDVFPTAAADTFRAHDRTVMKAGRAMEWEEIAPHGDGPHTYISVKFPLRDAAGAIVAIGGISTDITERARLYEAEQQARAQAEAALRLRDEFLSVASHELKTPMTSLRGQAQIALRRYARAGKVEPERIERTLRIIDQQAGKLARLVDHLLDISRIEAGKLALEREATDLVRLVRDAVDAAQSRTERHTLTVRAPCSVSAVIDPLRIEQVLTNLLDNAVKYSPDGGPIRVDVDHDGAAMRITVRDHGLGISPEHRPHIFSRFHQAHTSTHASGMGLGLYISKQIAELHGGTITAEFPDDGGTRFVVTLPTGV